jgi:hypothetical protein
MAAATTTQEAAVTWADVWSGHQLLAYSGVDGPTEWSEAVEGRCLPDRLGLSFDSLAGVALVLRFVTERGVVESLPGAGTPGFGAWRHCRIDGDRCEASLELDSPGRWVEVCLAFEAHDLLRGTVRYRANGHLDDPGVTLALELRADACRRVDRKGLVLEDQQARLVFDPPAEAQATAPEQVDDVLAGRRRALPHYVGEPAAQSGLYSLTLRNGEAAQFGLVLGREKPAPQALDPDSAEALAQPRAPWPVPPALASLDPLLARARSKAISILRAATFAPESTMPRRWIVSQRTNQRCLYAFHAPVLALGALTFDPELAGDQLRSTLAQQQADGMVPELAWPGGQTLVTPPPLLCWGFWRVFRATRDASLLADSVSRLKDYVKHPLVSRMLERLGHARSRGAKFLSWGRGEGAGMDNSPRFEANEPFAAVDLTSFAVGEVDIVSRIIEQVYPEHREAVHLGWMGEELGREIREFFWRPETGFFYDRYPDNDWVDVRTVAGFAPLFAGIASDAQAEQMVTAHLRDPQGFATPFPLPSLAADDPRFDGNMWRGGVWPMVNLLVVVGLERYGFSDEANALRRATLEQLARWFARTGTFWEFYDPLAARSPADLPRGRHLGALPDHAVSAASYLWLLHELADGEG